MANVAWKCREDIFIYIPNNILLMTLIIYTDIKAPNNINSRMRVVSPLLHNENG